MPVVAAAAVLGAPVVGNPNIIVDWANIVVDELDKEDSIQHIIYQSGTKLEAQIFLLAEDGLAWFSYVRILTDKYISTMASVIETRIQGNGRSHFGIRRTNYLRSPVHWVQNFYRTSEKPNIKGINQIVFLSQLERALSINEIRISMKANTLPESKKYIPGPLKS